MPDRENPFSFASPGAHPLLTLLSRLAERAVALDRIADIYHRCAGAPSPVAFLDAVLDCVNVRPVLDEQELARIPRTGPLIVAANHPFGGIDGVLLLHTLLRVRDDVKMLANFLLMRIRPLAPAIIEADPFAEGDVTAMNRRAALRAIRWLKSGHALMAFPAGEVSHLQLANRRVLDPAWQCGVVTLAQAAGAAVLPAYIHGRNSGAFQVAGLVHPRLRTALLAHEFLNKRDCRVPMRFGTTLAADRLAREGDEGAQAERIRRSVYLLALSHDEVRRAPERERSRAGGTLAPLAAEGDAAAIRAEVAALGGQHWLQTTGRYHTFAARAAEIPVTFTELTRLRERTFREIGEGTGHARDRDIYDDYYSHLVLWDAQQQCIAGGYRFCMADDVVRRFGVRGLYTHSLFRYRTRLLDRLTPAIELGRSFVTPEHQRSFAPLSTLWSGILRVVARNPRYRYLFGAVSISNTYRTASQTLLVRFMQANRMDRELSPMVRPKHPFRPLGGRLAQHLAGTDLDTVAELIQQLEADGKSVPVLLRQYLKVGGRILGFNVDPDFQDVVDCLLFVDLVSLDRRVGARHLGAEAFAQYLAYHEQQRGRLTAQG
jgi:putative hemolysin